MRCPAGQMEALRAEPLVGQLRMQQANLMKTYCMKLTRSRGQIWAECDILVSNVDEGPVPYPNRAR